jgi:monofunctional biosynthetic peptidoglycan transglycosylase
MKALLRWLALALFAAMALQLFFVVRIAAMAVLNPESTTFQRSEAWAQLTSRGSVRWRQQWVPQAQISAHLQRAVIAAEDDGFVNHDGVDWTAIEKAWEKNARAEAQTAKTQARTPDKPARAPKIRGGSTITQQLAKNLLLSGERTLLRKGQEFILALALEQLLSKQRILEIYLNNVEWGEGVFGAEAAAQHYFRKSAARLTPAEAARLAVMLPAPKRFEKMPGSAYLAGRTRTILARMGGAELP